MNGSLAVSVLSRNITAIQFKLQKSLKFEATVEPVEVLFSQQTSQHVLKVNLHELETIINKVHKLSQQANIINSKFQGEFCFGLILIFYINLQDHNVRGFGSQYFKYTNLYSTLT